MTASATEASEWHHSIWQQMMSATVPYKFSNTIFNKLIEMTDLQWEFFFTCWKYNLEFWNGGDRVNAKFSLGVPIYYQRLGKRLFGQGIRYPLARFAGVPDRFLRKQKLDGCTTFVV